MKNVVVLISGCQGSGKTTTANNVADLLRSEGINVVRTRFAAVLYEMHDACVEIGLKYGLPLKKKESRLLQVMGTEWMRESVDVNGWVNAAKGKVKHEFSLNPDKVNVAVMDDCRFDNEFHSFDNEDVEVIRVRLVAPESERKVRADAWRDDTSHASETGLDLYDERGMFDIRYQTGSDGCSEMFVANDLFKRIIEKIS